jgi:CubicO group peptidase (beta-lactamase class C family)
MPASAFGHTGFTGTSLWIDPEAGRIAILLTNRVHPDVRPIDFNAVRKRFHEAVWS